MVGLNVGTTLTTGGCPEDRFASSLRYVRHLMDDPVMCIAYIILLLLINSCDTRYTRRLDLSRPLNECFAYLQDEGYASVEFILGKNYRQCSLRWDRQVLCRLVSTLVEAADLEYSANFYIGSILGLLIEGRYAHRDALMDLLYAFVQAGEHVNELDDQQWSPSMLARYYDYWSCWCEAVQDSGKDIEEVLRAEGTEWLLQDDWGEVLEQRYGSRIEIWDSNSESESDWETIDEDGENESDGEQNERSDDEGQNDQMNDGGDIEEES